MDAIPTLELLPCILFGLFCLTASIWRVRYCMRRFLPALVVWGKLLCSLLEGCARPLANHTP